jgi:D-apiose dehydrogenase
VETTELSTDLGQPQNPSSVEGLLLYAEQLFGSGFAQGCSPDDAPTRHDCWTKRSERIVRVFRGALIGCGFFSKHHQEASRRMANVRIVAACDRDIGRARAVAEHAYVSVEEMLKAEELDFVDIVTRSETHLEIITTAARNGLAISCQKPMAPNWEDACRIVEIVQANRVRLMIHDNWRWQPWYRAAHDMITRGDIGIPLAYGFRCRWKDGAGAVPYPKQAYFRDVRRLMIDETLVHHIDTARFLFGDISSVCAQARRVNPRIRAEDHAMLMLRHANEVMGSIDGHSFLAHEENSPALDEAIFEGDSGSIRVCARGEIWAGNTKIWTDDFSRGYRGDSVYAALTHFIQCLETGLPFESEAPEYLDKTFAVVEAAYASLASRRLVEIEEIVAPSAH